MEKRSHRRIRDLDVLTAFQGLVANEIGCARISMMASEQETLPQWAEYRCARPIISRSSHPACTARPVHTKYIVVGLVLLQDQPHPLDEVARVPPVAHGIEISKE